MKPLKSQQCQKKQQSNSSTNKNTEILPLSERLRLKKLLASLDDSSMSVEDVKEDMSPPPVDMSSSFSSVITDDPNFSLCFELTKLLSNDVSILQNHHLEEVSEKSPGIETKGNRSDETFKEPSPTFSCPSVTKDHLNFSLNFEFTRMLDENDSLLLEDKTGIMVDERTGTRQTEDDTEGYWQLS